MMTRRNLLQSTLGLALAGVAEASAQSFFPGLPNLGMRADTGPPRSECGVGALMPWADALWAVTYNSHKANTGTGLGLYRIAPDLSMELVHRSNGTHANRFVHTQSNQLFIGPYAIDASGKFRVIDALLGERLTATMAHLTDSANRVYMLTMEGGFYEMDVTTLQPRRLYDLVEVLQIKQQPHFKGGFTGQGRVVVANNTYSKWNEREGSLAEWEGQAWRILSRKPHMECAGRDNMGNAIFTTGWDEASALFTVLIDGAWRHYRLPKASHTFDQFWQTEWTRIREVETERFLMDCHGMFYELSPMIFEKSVWGVRPISTHLRVIPDYCSFRGLLVLGGNENTPNMDVNPLQGQPQSGLWFGKTDDLWKFGKPQGWGGPWRFTQVRAGDISDPFLMTGFEHKVLHLKTDREAILRIEIDFLGMGDWELYSELKVPGYTYHVFPEGFSAHWVRLVAKTDCTATAEFVYT